MEQRLARALAARICAMDSDRELNANIVSYGFELIISTLLEVALLMIVSAMLRCFWAWIPFLLGFAPLRTSAGGYHASTHRRCYVVSTAAFAIGLLLSIYIPIKTVHYILMSFFSLIVVFALAPVPAGNKPMTENRRKSNRLRSLIIALAILAVAIICYLGEFCNMYIAIFQLGGTFAAMSLVVAKIIEKLRKEKNNEKVDS